MLARVKIPGPGYRQHKLLKHTTIQAAFVQTYNPICLVEFQEHFKNFPLYKYLCLQQGNKSPTVERREKGHLVRVR